jgi:hypothetical protein
MINEYLKLDDGTDRLFFFGIIFCLSVHFGACFWLIIAIMLDTTDFEGTWLARFYDQYGTDENALYSLSLYWTVTTITTVGYGDIVGTNTQERIFCSLIMIIGVISFSFANGALATILASSD